VSNYLSAAHEAIAKAFNPRRFNGYIPDDAARRKQQKSATLKFGASPTVPTQASLAKFRAPIFDQGQTGSCTGHGTAQAVYTSMNAAGSPLPFVPSPRIIYGTARTLERASASIALTDSGAMPTDLLTVLRTYGIAPIGPMSPDGRFSDIWSTDDVWGLATPPPPNVNVDMDLLDLESSGLRLLTGEYRVDEGASSFGPQLSASIAGMAAGGIGIFVDTAFMNWNPSTGPIQRINLADPNGGGHWLSCDYFYTDPQLGLILGGPNSWGQLNWPSGGPPPRSPYWVPGCYEMTATCLQSVCSDCLLFPTKVLS
jgi:hypothetical protein